MYVCEWILAAVLFSAYNCQFSLIAEIQAALLRFSLFLLDHRRCRRSCCAKYAGSAQRAAMREALFASFALLAMQGCSQQSYLEECKSVQSWLGNPPVSLMNLDGM